MGILQSCHCPNEYKQGKIVKKQNSDPALLLGAGNDYTLLLSEMEAVDNIPVSIVVLTYNRTVPLEKTLTGLLHQDYPLDLLEVIITDDGGDEDVLSVVRKFSKKLNIKYVWHPDAGFTAGAARNNGVALAKNDFIILLDVDIYPGRNLVSEYMMYHKVIGKVTLLSPRKYIDLNHTSIEDLEKNAFLVENLPEVITNNAVASKLEEKRSIDWRLEVFAQTDLLKRHPLPFKVFASCAVAFSKSQFQKVGGFDEGFKHWGLEDTELAFRFFNRGLYIVPVLSTWVYHQEPKNYINETDRAAGHEISKEYYAELCPYFRHYSSRKKKNGFIVPKLSIILLLQEYDHDVKSVIENIQKQTFSDMEIVIFDESKQHNISEVIDACKGVYIGLIDASDCSLAEDIIEGMVNALDCDLELGMIYKACQKNNFIIFRKLYWHRVGEIDLKSKFQTDKHLFDAFAKVCYVKSFDELDLEKEGEGQNALIAYFNVKAYLDANPDISKAISDGAFSSALEHLEHFGLKEIEDGSRQFHKDFTPFNEENYFQEYPDVKEAVENAIFPSAFEHFRLFGYAEIMQGKRQWKRKEA